MATKIRLKRIGRRNKPFYRMVVMDSRNKRDGAAIEELGWFNPIEADKPYSLNEERILHWMKLGAQPSEAAHGLMKRSGLAHRWHLTKQGLDENAIEKEMKKWVLTREETLNNRAEKAEKKAQEAKLKAEEAAAVAAKAAAAEPVEEAPAKEDAPAEETARGDAPTEEPAEAEPVEEAAADEASESPEEVVEEQTAEAEESDSEDAAEEESENEKSEE